MTVIVAGLCAGLSVYCWFVQQRTPRNLRRVKPSPVAERKGTPRLRLSEAALALELMSALMNAGASLTQAMRILGTQREQLQPLNQIGQSLEHGLSWQQAWEHTASQPGWAVLGHELRFVYLAAAPTATMLVAAAAQLRHHESHLIKERSQELSSKLVLPTGLLSLPAFICWGIMPAVLALFGSIDAV